MEKYTLLIKENIRLLLGLAVVIFAVILIISILVNNKGGKAAEVSINKQQFKVTIAKTEQEKQIGLSKTRKLADNQGMLFLFGNPDFYSFWMKEMQFPIDIIYINGNKVVTIIENAQPPSESGELPTYQPKIKSDKVLEVNAGLAKKYNIQEGSIIEIENL